MNLRWLGNAGWIITAEDGTRIACDPWLSPTAYYGMWHRDGGPGPEALDGVHFTWVSHLHPDHYDPTTLAAYHGQLYVGAGRWNVASLRITAVPHANNYDHAVAVIDTATNMAVVNLVDCPPDVTQWAALARHVAGCDHLTLLAPYSGAGPWPQAFRNPRPGAAEEKRSRFLAAWAQAVHTFKPTVAIPHGGYLLDPVFTDRGMASPKDADQIIGGHFDVVLPECEPAVEVPWVTDWETRPWPDDHDLDRRLQQALGRLDPPRQAITIEPIGAGMGPRRRDGEDGWLRVWVDARLLDGLLRGVYRWDVAEIGSCLVYDRWPDVHVVESHRWLRQLKDLP